MFNSGAKWSDHLIKTRNLILSRVDGNESCIIDIGCGDGHFLLGLAQTQDYRGKYYGFDPSSEANTHKGVEFYSEYFVPEKHFEQYKPTVLTLRHVLEHLTDPKEFLERISASAPKHSDTFLFIEVPCIDVAIAQNRLSDFFYEHVSHFTSKSFQTLIERTGEVIDFEYSYCGEVMFCLIKLGNSLDQKFEARVAMNFSTQAELSLLNIRSQLAEISEKKGIVAIWGGIGKSAAFMQLYHVDKDRFPIVVDSDMNKVGTFVPGCGQKIQSVNILKSQYTDVVIIPTRWRAQDIAMEIHSQRLAVGQILVEDNGSLIQFEPEHK